MKHLYLSAFLFSITITSAQELNLQQANALAKLPVKCLQQEYPNKLSQLLADASELQSPKELHPAFYGCFDWHSSVHAHWSLVYLLKKFPNLEGREDIIAKLKINLSKENIAQEVAYLNKKHEKSYERMYGWAWLLKLQQELNTYNEPFAKELAVSLQPLTTILAERYIEFLPKLNYPIRVGTHTSTAFGLNLAWDYAIQSKDLLCTIRRKNMPWFSSLRHHCCFSRVWSSGTT
jgi:hypothetical protein